MDLPPPPPIIPAKTPVAIIEQMERPQPVTRRCLEQVSAHYRVHPLVLSLVAGVEGGQVGMAMHNGNGTQDLGIMQINTIHLKQLSERGITRKMLMNNGCVNVAVAAWYLRDVTHGVNARTPKEIFRAIARYHSKTEKHNRAYARKLMRQFEQLVRDQGEHYAGTP